MKRLTLKKKKIVNRNVMEFPKAKEYQIVSYISIVPKGTPYGANIDSAALFSGKLDKEVLFFGNIQPQIPKGKLSINLNTIHDGEYELCLHDRYKMELDYDGYERHPIIVKEGIYYTLF